MKYKKLILVTFCIYLAGCTITNYKVPDTNLQQEDIITQGKIGPEDIIIKKKYRDISRVKFVVLRTRNNVNYNAYNSFMKVMLERIGFKKVLSEEEFAKKIIENGVDEKIGATYDLISLHKIYKEFGEFLVITAALNNANSYWWDNQIIIVDPEEPSILVKMHDYNSVDMSIDYTFNYPTINFLNQWYKSSL